MFICRCANPSYRSGAGLSLSYLKGHSEITWEWEYLGNNYMILIEVFFIPSTFWWSWVGQFSAGIYKCCYFAIGFIILSINSISFPVVFPTDYFLSRLCSGEQKNYAWDTLKLFLSRLCSGELDPNTPLLVFSFLSRLCSGELSSMIFWICCSFLSRLCSGELLLLL